MTLGKTTVRGVEVPTLCAILQSPAASLETKAEVIAAVIGHHSDDCGLPDKCECVVCGEVKVWSTFHCATRKGVCRECVEKSKFPDFQPPWKIYREEDEP